MHIEKTRKAMKFRRVRNLRHGTESFEDTDHFLRYSSRPALQKTNRQGSSWNFSMLRLNSAMFMMIICIQELLLPKAAVAFQFKINKSKLSQKCALQFYFLLSVSTASYLVRLGWNHFCIGNDFCWISFRWVSITISQFGTRIVRIHPNPYIRHLLNRSLVDMPTAALFLIINP